MKSRNCLFVFALKLRQFSIFLKRKLISLLSTTAKKDLKKFIRDIKQTLEIAQQGETLRDGFKVALVGQTNAGKSSILNRLAGDEIAIVSDVAGTTRDKIQTLIHLERHSFPISQIPQVLEKPSDKVEKIGIERAKMRFLSPTLLSESLTEAIRKNQKNDEKILSLVKQLTHEDIPILTVLNKSDLLF